MTPTDIIPEAIALLEKGHVEQADLELRRWLGHHPYDRNRFWVAISEAAQLIHPYGEPKKALAVLKRAIETMEQGVSTDEP